MTREEVIWKTIKGFSNYEVSNTGKIRSKDRKTWHKGSKTYMNIKAREMKQRWNKLCKCYFMDLINDDGKRRTVYPHREVALAFCINVDQENKTKVIHLDNNSENNDSTNLEWVTPSEHMQFQFMVGNKDNYEVWKVRRQRYKNGFKDTTVFVGRGRKKKGEAVKEKEKVAKEEAVV